MGEREQRAFPLQKKCFHVQVSVAENGLPKCEADSPRFEHAAVLRHVKGLKNISGIFGGAALEVLMCMKSAQFWLLWKSFKKVCFPPLPPFAMATGWGLNKYPLGTQCRQLPGKERCSECRHSWKKRKIPGITRWDNSACNDATLNCVKSEPKSALPYSYGLAHHECSRVLNSALDTCFMLCC